MIRRYLKQCLAKLIGAALLSIASALCSVGLLTHLSRLAGSSLAEVKLVHLALSLLMVGVVFLANFASQLFMARLSAEIIARLRTDLSERFLQLDYEKMMAHKHQVTGALIADVSRVAPFLLLLPQLIYHGLTTTLGLTYLGFLSLPLFGVFTCFMIFAIICSLLIFRQTMSMGQQLRAVEDNLYEHFRAIAEGKKELTLNRARADHFLHEALGKAIASARDLIGGAHKWWGFGEAWSSAMIFIALFLVIYCGQALFSQNATTILQFVVVALFLMGPINFLVAVSRDITLGLASVRHLEELGVAVTEAAAASTPVPVAAATFEPESWRGIHLRDLVYHYREDNGHGFQFGPVDLHIPRGRILFIIGGNGSGKSTLALLLTGLIKPASGHIEIDGAVVGPETIDRYRALFTGVFFDFYLFRHIIDRHGDQVPDAVVNALLEQMDLHHKVTSVDGVLSTLNLSQGQRKRLALVQSCIDDSDIYLFDEWAADQDPVFRQYFYAELLPNLKRRGKTVLVITHDERYFSTADTIIKLAGGKVCSVEETSTLTAAG